jgi:hypothetical protein
MSGWRTSPISGICSMNPTIGVTKFGHEPSGGVCGRATTAGGAAAAANAVTVDAAGPASPDVVTGLTAFVRVGVRPDDSCRAAAINIQVDGDSGAPVDPLPAKGFRTALTRLDIAVVTTATGACRAVTVGRAGCCTSALTTDAVRATDTLAVGAGSSATLVDSVANDCTVRAVAIPVFPVEPTASRVVPVDGCEALDFFFFFFGAGSVTADFVSLESVVVFSSAGCLLSDNDVPEVEFEEFVDDDSDPDALDRSADATPCPTKTAAPIPRATASAPMRPTYAPAPMFMCLPSTGAPVCALSVSAAIASQKVNFDGGCRG